MRSVVSGLLELLGLASLVVGAAILAPWLGWLVAGAALLVVGRAIDPPVASPVDGPDA